ncbi:MAG: low molecular weight protein-tyrosine-phosphatase [Alphaproteobacteria bacterium]|nr:low molecular weight protein-tyrosine-phosphatase [Alphaproteobacteria bacterium]
MSSKRILFVCLGNICRSPTAEGIFQKLLREKGLEDAFEIDSAGTGNWHIGKPPEPRATEEALRRGVDISGLRARQVSPDDLLSFDHVLAMDLANLDDLEALVWRLEAEDSARRIARPRLFLSYAPDSPEQEVPDPYYEGGFDYVFDLLEAAARGLLAELQDKPGANNKNT